MDIKMGIDLCTEYAYATRSPNTARAYTNALQRLMIFLKENEVNQTADISAVSMEHFIRFPSWLLMQYSKPTTVTWISGAKFFLDWLVLQGYLEPSYSETLRYQLAVRQIHRKNEHKLPRFPEEDDVDKMLKAARELAYDSPIKERDIALMEFLASTGCRISEVCNLKVHDLDNTFGSAVVTGKGNKERRVYINASAKLALLHYWEARGFNGPNDPVFTRHDKGVGRGAKFKIKKISPRTGQNIVDDVAALAGIETFSPHYFRHAFAIKALNESGNLALVQDLLGHASPTATRVYAKIRPKDLEEAHHEIFG